MGEKELSNFEPVILSGEGILPEGALQRWDRLADQISNDCEKPKIESYDVSGNIIDRIWFPEQIRRLRREVVEAGIFKNKSQMEQMTKVFHLAHIGESSVCCPLACTEGFIRVIEVVGSEFLKETVLPRLRSPETPVAGAQFITEQDMGSDVGALTTKAIPLGDGKWKLEGEKWFCSAIDEFFLIAARPEGAPEGTKGVAIFYAPRTIDGKLNGIRIKRLKQKLGTREMPTAEIDLNGAIGWNIGPVENGFKNLMNYVINTSRIMNAACACGFMSRAYLEAENYAKQRSAFGKKIIEYPMIQESLEKIRTTLESRKGLYFHLVSELDKNPQKDLKSDVALWQRFLINLCKYRTSLGATECAREALLILAGNGTVETFSCLPRLYRDGLVLETWEGSHNTLALQICRDGLRFRFRDFLEKHIHEREETFGKQGVSDGGRLIESEWRRLSPVLEHLSDAKWVSRHARHLIDQLGELLEAAWSPPDFFSKNRSLL